ncbi:MAG: diacylglucosamine hydrolase like protein [Sulfurimonas sp. RIFOXYD12_FULL_33_39]|uniref:epoxyqueuosine reductase QueH n=1 Tax=unclassified Sulfurimonas TaxID=2623549 RepID=UPI0008C0AD37|nr:MULTISPECIES: epoxyqueuosine reductase QueH [unclassified Sulfurimonas]OHE09149.1 MAG: diacylglucosamine hydrolase like protein [Sulfurimonas sp. RIFOXYD12_FULL_33_39]OHE14466.1 MAG: diacylglucosamine hydrolase like protein [Sulfurimonas sp. RIFOXYD2_FULL_34_21]DAB28635.1 MAG TPA: diacylglucosamine hydrolase like protein [Sulfurimonas sp. UBA10385]
MLVHICCSVDSHFFLEKLQHDYPDEKLIGFFYDPNIHPYSEYQLRLLDVKRSCKKLGIELLEGEYDFVSWMEAVRGLENEPEKGARCEVCFDRRFEVSAKKALELNESKITTTLLVSPLKSQEQLKRSGDIFFKKYGVEFIAYDYRKEGGTQDQSRVTKEQQLYRQDYCGCIYGLTMQREQQERLMDEMFSPISNQVLPASIEERLDMYKHRMELEDKNIAYKIVKEKFLNYRQFNFKLFFKNDTIIPAYALSYSTMPRKKAQGSIEFIHDNIGYFNREEIRFVTLDFFNTTCNFEYKTVNELIFNQPDFEEEQKFRSVLTNKNYDLSPIIIVDEIPHTKLTIELDAKIYEDVREKLIII